MSETYLFKNRDQILKKLKSIPFLQSFKKDYLGEILSKSHIKEYEENQPIISEDAHDKSIYILLDGEIRVMKKNAEIAHLKNTGDIFGELAMIKDGTRSASVYAHRHSFCLMIDISGFDTLDSEERAAIYSIIYRLFAEILADRLRDTSQEVARLQNELYQTKESLDRLKKMVS